MSRRMYALAFVVLTVIVAGCSHEPAEPNAPIISRLQAGTSVRLMLLQKLESGKHYEGQSIPLVVAENVVDDQGRTLVRAGTRVTATVTQSRAAGALSSMLNSPARLRIKFDPLVLNSVSVDLSGEKDKLEDFGFTAKSVDSPEERLKAAVGDAGKRQVLESIHSVLEGTKSADQIKEDLGDGTVLRNLLNELDLKQAEGWMEREESVAEGLDRVASSLDKLRRGDVTALSGGEITLALAAIEEFGALADDLSDGLKGIFKGRNIRPTVGSLITAYCPKSVELPVIQPASKP